MEKDKEKIHLLGVAASERLSLGGLLVRLGEKDGGEVYTVEYESVMTVGWPEVYVWDGKRREVRTIMGDEAGLLIASLREASC